MDLHVFPIPIPPPASFPIPSLWIFPVHQPWALVSCIQPGLAICFTLDSILVSMLFSQNIPPLPSLTESKSLFCTSVSLFLLIYTNGFKVFFILVKSLNSVQHFATPWTVAHQAPLSMGFFQAKVLEWVAIFSSRGSSWPRDRIWSPTFQADTLPSEPPGKPHSLSRVMNIV